MKILVLNSGSSSQKSALYEVSGALPGHPPTPAWEGKIEWDSDLADMQVQTSQGARQTARTVEQMVHMSEQLNEALSQFRVSSAGPSESRPELVAAARR